jgi:hypothetical protein
MYSTHLCSLFVSDSVLKVCKDVPRIPLSAVSERLAMVSE